MSKSEGTKSLGKVQIANALLWAGAIMGSALAISSGSGLEVIIPIMAAAAGTSVVIIATLGEKK